MRLYLLRHADATYEAKDDFSRELSPKGKRSLKQLLEQLRPKELAGISEIRHSPLVRATQSAHILRDTLELKVPLRKTPGLLPEDDPVPLIEELLCVREDVLLIGHNPHLTFLAALLLTGQPHHACIVFKKAGLLCLERVSGATARYPGGHWALSFYLVPRVAGKD